MINTTIPEILLICMMLLSVFEGIAKKEKRFASLLATMITVGFLSITTALTLIPNPDISALLISTLGTCFGLVYFYESYTGSGIILIYKIIKGKGRLNGQKTK